MKIRQLKRRSICLQSFGTRRYIRWMPSCITHVFRGSIVTPEEIRNITTGEIGRIEGFRFYVS